MPALVRKWQLVVVGVVLGGLLAVAGVAYGLSVAQSAVSFAIVVAYAVLVAAMQGRSETAAALAGRPVDERWQAIHEHALGFTAEIGVGVSLLGVIVAELRHLDPGPYGQVAAVMGAAYLAGIAIFRWRT